MTEDPIKMSKPLDGVNVLDFTNLLPGPYCTLELVRNGARVIKVERVGAGDPLRLLPPRLGSRNAFFWFLNRGKESIQIDLRAEAGLEIARRLAAWADVLVESFRPGVMRRLGLGPAEVLNLNPRLVYASLSAFGADDPRPGHDLNFVAQAGLLGLYRDTGLQAPPLQLGDLSGGKEAASKIVLALFERERTGRGQFLDIGMTEGVFDLASPALMEFLASRQAGTRFGRRRPLTGLYPCYNVYPTRDGKWVALGALEPPFWAAFCEHFGVPRWVGRQFDASEDFRREVTELFRSRDFAEWEQISRTTAFCLTPVYEMEDLVESEYGKSRLSREGIPGPPGETLGPPPEPGEHTGKVLRQLGYAAEEVGRLLGENAASGRQIRGKAPRVPSES